MQIYDDADLREKLAEHASWKAELLVTPEADVSRRNSIMLGMERLDSAICEYRDTMAELRNLMGEPPIDNSPDPDGFSG